MTPPLAGHYLPASMGLLRATVSWLATIPFLLLFGGLLVLFDPLQRLAYLFGRRAHRAIVDALQWSLVQALRVCGTRFAFERHPAVEPGRPYVVISNHQSMFDIPILTGGLFWSFPLFVSKRELARGIPSISYNLRVGGSALIDRSDRQQARQAIRALGQRIREWSVSAVIFPEGTRARDGQLKAFKPGGALELIAAAEGLAVLPAAIDGSWKLLRHSLRPVPFGTRVRVWLGEPMDRAGGESPEELLRRAELAVQATLRRWRGEGGEARP